jgi:hypothetical protein
LEIQWKFNFLLTLLIAAWAPWEDRNIGHCPCGRGIMWAA